MAVKSKQPVYSVRGVKTFTGTEGEGFNATLLRDGKPIAFVIDDAGGGEMTYDWLDSDAPRVKVQVTPKYSYMGTPWQAEFTAYARSLPPIDMSEYSTPTEKVEPLPMSPDCVMGKLVDEYRARQRLRRLCRTKTIFRLQGMPDDEWMQLNHPYSKELGDRIRAKYGDKLLVIENER